MYLQFSNLSGKAMALVGAILSASACVAEDPIEVTSAQVSLIQNTFIAAPISGVVAEVNVAEGDRVDVGNQLAKLEEQHARTELKAAQAAFEAARLEGDNDTNARYATRTKEVRQRELQQSLDANLGLAGTVSEAEIEKQRLIVDQAQLAIEQALHQQTVARAKAVEKQAAVDIATDRLSRHRILSAVSGSVAEVDIQVGEWVEAGKPMIRLISLDPIRVECFIDGRRYGPELVGRQVEFLRTGSPAKDEPAKWIGQVTFVSSELLPVTGQVRLWATIANPEQKLRAGMQGKLRVLPVKK